MDFIFEPWPWYVGGPLIALVLFSLLFLNKNFGMSSNLKTICTLCGAGKTSSFFQFDWKTQRWNLIVILGASVGGWLGANALSNDLVVDIKNKTVEQLKTINIHSGGTQYMPEELFSLEAMTEPKTLALLLLGGFLVGFGTRYAGGCTSGHAISGLSNLQLVSLFAVIGFFIGGILMSHFVLPQLF